MYLRMILQWLLQRRATKSISNVSKEEATLNLVGVGHVMGFTLFSLIDDCQLSQQQAAYLPHYLAAVASR